MSATPDGGQASRIEWRARLAALAACAALAAAGSARAEVRSLSIAVSTTCPYGIVL